MFYEKNMYFGKVFFLFLFEVRLGRLLTGMIFCERKGKGSLRGVPVPPQGTFGTFLAREKYRKKEF